MVLLKNYCIISGVGMDRYAIGSFDSALINADVGNYNLVRVSSILPPGCVKKESIDVQSGMALHTAYAVRTIFGAGIISSAVAVAIPENKNEYGVIMEYSDSDSKVNVIKKTEQLAQEAMEKRKIKVARILSIGAEAQGGDELYTTTFAGIALF